VALVRFRRRPRSRAIRGRFPFPVPSGSRPKEGRIYHNSVNDWLRAAVRVRCYLDTESIRRDRNHCSCVGTIPALKKPYQPKARRYAALLTQDQSEVARGAAIVAVEDQLRCTALLIPDGLEFRVLFMRHVGKLYRGETRRERGQKYEKGHTGRGDDPPTTLTHLCRKHEQE
jgi:hypothetical protein